jgi:hypothetical protein
MTSLSQLQYLTGVVPAHIYHRIVPLPKGAEGIGVPLETQYSAYSCTVIFMCAQVERVHFDRMIGPHGETPGCQ